MGGKHGKRRLVTGGEKAPDGLKPEDLALWAKVAESMDARHPEKPTPDELRRMIDAALSGGHARRGARPPAATSSAASPGSGHATAPASGVMKRDLAAPRFPAPEPLAKRTAPPGGTLDKRTRQRLMRGRVDIEARIDLHGLGVEEARLRLRAFIVASRQRGLRTVLVITGKGAAPYARHTLHGRDHWHAPERAGILRRELPRWLSEPDMAPHVAGFQPAHPRHGGGGAFYVRLRRRDRGHAP